MRSKRTAARILVPLLALAAAAGCEERAVGKGAPSVTVADPGPPVGPAPVAVPIGSLGRDAPLGRRSESVAASRAEERRVALVIGNGSYTSLPRLPNALNDAADMAQILKEQGWEVIVELDADRARLRQALDRFAARLTPSSHGFVYFSGHGVQVDNQNFVVPVDSSIRRVEDVPNAAVSTVDMLYALQRAGGGCNMVVLDACSDSGLETAGGDRPKGLARMFAPPGTLIAFAADIDQFALSGTGRNGIYTGALLKELRDRRRRVEDIFQAVREDVRNAVGDRQKPVEFTSLTRPCYLGGVYEWLRPFRDCPDCPWVVPLPAGRFTMGSDDGPPSERPAHEVAIGEPFAIGRYEVTFAEWDACVADGGCKTKDDRGWGRGNRPVIGVSRDDANAYVRWLSARTGNTYRLPTEAEWEYAARAATTTRYPWADEIGSGHANCSGCGSPFEGQTAPVGSFAPNPFGLHDMNGNVWEWVEDCFSDGYVGAPRDGRAVVRTICRQTVLRGGSYKERAGVATSTFRGRGSAGYPREDFGFRVVRVLQ